MKLDAQYDPASPQRIALVLSAIPQVDDGIERIASAYNVISLEAFGASGARIQLNEAILNLSVNSPYSDDRAVTEYQGAIYLGYSLFNGLDFSSLFSEYLLAEVLVDVRSDVTRIVSSGVIYGDYGNQNRAYFASNVTHVGRIDLSLVPEPDTLALCALGIVGLRLRNSTRKGAKGPGSILNSRNS